MILLIVCSILSFFSLSNHLTAQVIKPEDILSQEEIDEFMDQKNFFFSDAEDRLQRKYSKHLHSKRDQYYSMGDVVQKTLTDSIPLQYKIQKLHRAGIDRHISWGAVIPKLSISVGEGLSPINLNSMFTNLFGFLMPHHWMNLIGKNRAYKATRYLFLKSALDEKLNVELYYLRIHRSIREFEIINFYLVHMELLSRLYPQSSRNFKTIQGRFAGKAVEMALKRGEVKLRFDDLALTMALEKGRGDDYAAERINIYNIEDFPSKIPPLESLEPVYHSKEAFVREVLNQSIELKSIKEFYEISKLNVGITAFGSVVENTGAEVNNGNKAQFGLHFGYDTLPQIIKSVSFKRTAKIDVRQEYLKMLDLARRSYDLYTNALGLYHESKRMLEYTKESFFLNLNKLIEEGAAVDGAFLFSFDLVFDAELKLNQAFHESLEAKGLMDRLLMHCVDEVFELLPKEDEVKAAHKFFEENHNYFDDHIALTDLDQRLRQIYKRKQLQELLETHQNNDSQYRSEDFHKAISKNMPHLLEKKWFRRKTSKFFKLLYDYVLDHNIDLSDYNQNKLRKRSRSTVQKYLKL